MIPRATIVVGRVVHPTPPAPEPRCHAGAGHQDNVHDRGAAGELCGPCLAALVRILRGGR